MHDIRIKRRYERNVSLNQSCTAGFVPPVIVGVGAQQLFVWPAIKSGDRSAR